MLEVLPSSICEHMYINYSGSSSQAIVLLIRRWCFITMARSIELLRKAGSITLSVDGSIMKFKTKLKNLGVIFDSNLTFEPHVQGTVKTSFFHLRNIARLRPMLSFPVAERLINTFVFTRIDYCNALLAGASKATLHK